MSTVIVTEKEVADRLRITTRTLRNWRGKNIGPASMGLGTDGKLLRYRIQDVEAWELRHVSGGQVPDYAKKAMQRAASAIDMVLRWKDIGEPARCTLEGMRDDLRDILAEKKKVAP